MSGVFEDGLDGGTSDVLAGERAKASFSREVMAAFLAGGETYVVRACTLPLPCDESHESQVSL